MTNKLLMMSTLAALAILLGGCGGSAHHAPEAPSAVHESYGMSIGDAAKEASEPGMAAPARPMDMAESAAVGGADDSGGDEPAPPPPPSPAPPDPVAGAAPASAGPAAGATPVARAPTPAQPAPTKPAAKSPTSGAHDVAKSKEIDPDQAKSDATSIAQMLIFTGKLAILVEQDKIANSIDVVIDTAMAMGGYVVQMDNQNVTVRVPSGRFRDALRELEKLGEVTYRTVEAQDVSEEYNDLGVRLKSLRATRQRIEEFLARANTIAEVLQIEEQLSRLNGEIDRIEGRMRFLSARAAFSTIVVALQPKPKKQVVVEDDHQPPPARSIPLPIDWLQSVGLDQLLNLEVPQ